MGLCNDHFVIDLLSPRKSIGRHHPPNTLMMLMKNQSLFIQIYVSLMYYIPYWVYCVNWQRCIFLGCTCRRALVMSSCRGLSKKKPRKMPLGYLVFAMENYKNRYQVRKWGKINCLVYCQKLLWKRNSQIFVERAKVFLNL